MPALRKQVNSEEPATVGGRYKGAAFHHPFHPLLFYLRVIPGERELDICDTWRMVKHKLAQVSEFRDQEAEIGNSKIYA
jgi:hypothetical protein